MSRQVLRRSGSGARQVFGPVVDDDAPPPPTTGPAILASFISGHELVWADNNADPLISSSLAAAPNAGVVAELGASLLSSSFAGAPNAGLVADVGASFLYYAASAASLV